MKQMLVFAALLSVTGLYGQNSFQPASWGMPAGRMEIEGLQSGPVTGRPVSGKEVRRTSQTLSDGTLVEHSDVSYFYRDAVGRMREESPDRVEIFDPVARMEYDLNIRSKTYRRIPIPAGATSISVGVVGGASHTSIVTDSGDGHRKASSSDPNTTPEDLGRQTVNGLWAQGSRVTVKVPVGAFGNNREVRIVNERWYSEEFQMLLKSSNNDPRFGLNVYELTEIKQTPPNPALFEPPSDYKLVSRD